MQKKDKINNIYSTESTYRTECETPSKFILHKAAHTTDKKEAIYLLLLLFEIQKFCDKSDITNAIYIFSGLVHDNEWELIKKLFPFVETAYPQEIKQEAIYAISNIVSRLSKIPHEVQEKILEIARNFLINKTSDWHKMEHTNFRNYVLLKLDLIYLLSFLKPKYSNPILNKVVSNKEEVDIIVKVANGIIVRKPYKGDDFEQWQWERWHHVP